MAQLALSLARAYHNQQLLATWYLDERLRRDPLWDASAGEATALRAVLRDLLSRERAALASANEAQTETRWIRPVLDALGWGYEVQQTTQRHGAKQIPDYALFVTRDDARVARGDRGQLYARAAGVLEAKRWERDLDARDHGGERDTRVPSGQIVNYLVRTAQPWGILTNGREWRLYTRDAPFADSVYFAVDLPALLGDDPLALGGSNETIPAAEAFRYFYLFFCPAAFAPEIGGRCWLDAARESSTRYARSVEEALKPRAYRAVTALVRGFAAAHAIDGRALATAPAEGDVLLDNALTLLFRLLFLFYAESRDLLPVRTSAAYRNKSLLTLRARAAQARDDDRALFPRGRDLWNDLHDLFRIIDGAPEWRLADIPIYNGGLFDPAKHPWLETHFVTDPFLAEAIDLLSRVEDPEDGELRSVDYSPLDVRHLGSIYEGLLEYVVRAASDNLPPIRERGEIVRDPVRRGDLYLATDKGERRTSGSYYTPDYIVQYIVDRALAPLVADRSVDEVLAIRVLDPAMGSGHFLVAVTAYLARAAVLAAGRGEQLALDTVGDPDPNHLRRLVVERCVFGVDKNPRAVELAKLALWLSTVQHGKPLNFLDHHLRCGDSLLGARARDLARAPERRGREARMEDAGQYGASDHALRGRVYRALTDFDAIRRYLSDTPQQVQAKEGLFAHARGAVQRLRDLADLSVSASFPESRDSGTDEERRARIMDADRYDRALATLGASDAEWDALLAEPWFARARALAREHRFFHWDIDFAEAFFGDDGADLANPGFDAVVGNPPYVRMEEFRPIKDFLRARYATYETRADLYVYFMERSLDLLREGGEYGVIVSNKFLRANYGRPIRGLIGQSASVREIVDLGGLAVFPEATVRAAIVHARRGREAAIHTRWSELQTLDPDSFASSVAESSIDLDERAVRGEDWVLAVPEVASMLARLEQSCLTLGDEVNHGIFRGIVTGLNSAFFIDAATRARLLTEDPSSAEVLKPLVVGEEVCRYHLDRADHYLIYVPHGCAIDRYPAVLRHVENHREALAKRATSDSHEWYELQQPQEAFTEHFAGPKIVYPEMANRPRFAIDRGSHFINNKCFAIPGERWSLLAILNSRAAFFLLGHVGARLEGQGSAAPFVEHRTQYMERLPVPRVINTTDASVRQELGRWLCSLYARGVRLAGVEPEIPDDIRALGPRLGTLPGVQRVALFGSWARGEAHAESDIDLLVVREGNGLRGLRRGAVLAHLGGFGRDIDPHVFSPEELAEGAANGFLQHILPEGITLYERI